MKALSAAILEGMATFVLCVLVSCVMLAVCSYTTEISENMYLWIGWRLPVAIGVYRGFRYFVAATGGNDETT